MIPKWDSTLKGLAGWRTLSGFNNNLCSDPGLSLRSNHWAEISERLRRKSGLKLANAFGVSLG